MISRYVDEGMAVERRKKMHQTTVRFGPDLWAHLEEEAALNGVSVAQFVRDATLGRLAHAAGRRGEPFGLQSLESRVPDAARLEWARNQGASSRSGSEAVRAQARLARERARTVREAAREAQAAKTSRSTA